MRKVRETRREVARGRACFHGKAARPESAGQGERKEGGTSGRCGRGEVKMWERWEKAGWT